MQNSFWKLISVLGVVAIGTMVVLEVQKGLDLPNTAQQEIPPAPQDERAVIPPTESSQFDKFANNADDIAAGASSDPPELWGDFDEPTLSDANANSAPSLRNASEIRDVDPFAQSTFETDSVRAAADPVPASAAGFVDDGDSDDGGLLGFAADSNESLSPDVDFDPSPDQRIRMASNETSLPVPAADEGSFFGDPRSDPEPQETSSDRAALQFFSGNDNTSSNSDSASSEVSPEPTFEDGAVPLPDDTPSSVDLPIRSDSETEFIEDATLNSESGDGEVDLSFEEDEQDSLTLGDEPFGMFEEEESSAVDAPFNTDGNGGSEALDLAPVEMDTTVPADPLPDFTMDADEGLDSSEFDEEAGTESFDFAPVPLGDDGAFDDDGPLQPTPEADPLDLPAEFPDRFDRDSMDIRPRGGRDRDPVDFDAQPEIRPAPARRSAPTGVLRPHVTVTKRMPKTATLGVPLDYQLVITNEGESAATDVIVEDTVPVSAQIEAVEPPADYDKKSRRLIWRFDQLQERESRELTVRLTPNDEGVLNSEATVRFKAQITTSTVVRAPRLTLEMTSTPEEVQVGDTVQLTYLVKNEGTGTASDVVLRSDLPTGLRHPVGDDLEYTIDTLAPGEERTIDLKVVAVAPGESRSNGEILAAGQAASEARTVVNVVGQQIQVARRGPPKRFVGRSATYENILSNESQFLASNIRVIERVPDGMKFVRASHNGTFNPTDRSVTWAVDEIAAGDTERLKIDLVALKAGDQVSSVMVVENAGYQSAARHVTAVEDLHNIGSRMSRLDGPVSVGEEFGFDIAVKNRGTANATNVLLAINLPDGVKGVSVGKGGPRADAKIVSGQLQYRFHPVSQIEPDGEMMFRINLKATKPLSNGVVEARITYDQMQRQLVMTEAITAGE